MVTEAALKLLRAKVLDDMAQYMADFRTPPKGTTVGEPWGIEKISQELDKMRNLLVEPYETRYDCDDALIPAQDRLPKGKRKAYVVAEDICHRLLFDEDAGDFVLVQQSADGTWCSWGIRGDASSSFLAR
ncbi:hypothetical protein SB751_20285 [Cupriavidus sp. SIMBA_020]|uniref:hypothetical protein n=1 Tax=Cupriavidus sp. SIMBA_020 TaxID=3085766 RepID=UPI00397DE132